MLLGRGGAGGIRSLGFRFEEKVRGGGRRPRRGVQRVPRGRRRQTAGDTFAKQCHWATAEIASDRDDARINSGRRQRIHARNIGSATMCQWRTVAVLYVLLVLRLANGREISLPDVSTGDNRVSRRTRYINYLFTNHY